MYNIYYISTLLRRSKEQNNISKLKSIKKTIHILDELVYLPLY